MKIKRICSALLCFVLICAGLTVGANDPAWADAWAITSVAIKVNNELTVGDTVSDSSINIGEYGGDINVYVTSEKYEITSTSMVTSSTKELTVGDEVKIKVVLEPTYAYYFKGSFGSSKVSITGGEYASCSKTSSRMTVTLRLKPLKGTFSEPDNARWDSSTIGKAHWDKPDDKNGTGYYDLVLKRGGTEVHRVQAYSGTSYNFYPYMTKKGTYSFRVRTVANTDSQTTYGKSSAWIDSDEYELDEKHVSDGTGANTNTAGSAGWVVTNGSWYYKYPDGNYKKDGWAQVDGKWYLFSQTGIMLTGWQSIASGTYFLDTTNGDMHTGWITRDGRWSYLTSDPNSQIYGAVVTNQWLTATDNKTYYMDSQGYMCQGWSKIGDKWYYFDKNSGELARNTVVDTFNVGADGAWIN